MAPLHSISEYARTLRPHMPASLFEPVPARLLWLALHVAVATLGIWAIAGGGLGWPVKALLSVPIGLAFAGMAFVAHETLHGAVVRPRWARRLAGGLGFMPFLISARHWVAWHNRLHHGHTTVQGTDPDTYPTLEHYRRSRAVRAADRLSLGGRRLLGALTLVVGLPIQSLEVLLASGPRSSYLPAGQHRLALVETAAAAGVWIALAIWLGADVLLFGWLLPLALGGVVVMAHIVTNHGLSRMTEVNDPLRNSLSVTLPRWWSTYTLQFGLHVEHHMFPAVSARHAPAIRELIVARWPDRYRSLPLARALGRLFRSGRIYKDHATLCDPRSGIETPAL
jgi:fatty acid desaturase